MVSKYVTCTIKPNNHYVTDCTLRAEEHLFEIQMIMCKVQGGDAKSIVTEILADVWGKSKDKQECFSAGAVVSLFPNYCN